MKAQECWACIVHHFDDAQPCTRTRLMPPHARQQFTSPCLQIYCSDEGAHYEILECCQSTGGACGEVPQNLSVGHTRMVLCRAAAAASGSCEKSRPGLSMRRRFLSSTTSWAVRVTPGRLPTWTALARLRLLISEDLPTLGSPTMPVVAPPHTVRTRVWSPDDCHTWGELCWSEGTGGLLSGR